MDGFVTGLEPGSNYPNPKSVERAHGRVVNVPAGGTYRTETELVVHPTHEGVAAAEQAIAGLQGGRKAVVHREPHSRYLPKA